MQMMQGAGRGGFGVCSHGAVTGANLTGRGVYGGRVVGAGRGLGVKIIPVQASSLQLLRINK